MPEKEKVKNEMRDFSFFKKFTPFTVKIRGAVPRMKNSPAT